MSEAIGILGVGHLASYVVAGLRRVGDDRSILLSPRNRERALVLQREQACNIANTNQQVVDACPIVILAVRPNQLNALLNSLVFTAEHLVISCVAGVTLDQVKTLVGAAEVVRTLPLASAEVGEGVIPLFPDQAIARQLLNPLGQLISFDLESQFELASVAACINGWSYAFLDHLTDWFIAQGMETSQARELVVHSIRGATGLAQATPEVTLSDISESIATSGTFTKAGLDVLEKTDAFKPWKEACEHVKSLLDDSGAE